MLEDWKEALEELSDSTSAFINMALQAIRMRYGTQVLSRDEEHVVLLVPIEVWLDLEAHIEMFEAYDALITEREQIAQANTEGEMP